MKDLRILLYLLVTLIFAGSVGLLGQMYLGPGPLWEVLEIGGFRLAYLTSLIVLAAYSNFSKSWTFYLIAPGLLLLIVGIVFKVLHFPYANQMLLVSGIWIPVGYTIRFVFKRPITRNAVLKWLFVVYYYLFAMGTIFHWSEFFREWAFVSRILLLVASIDFLVTSVILQPKSYA